MRAAVEAIGEEHFGFKSSEIAIHSLHYGAAMAMFLDQIPVYIIMMIGRWSSDVFLKCIRKQVEQFSRNVAQRMGTKNDQKPHV